MKKLVILALMAVTVNTANAQLGDLLKSVASSAASSAATAATGSSTVGNIVANLLGTATVNENTIVGTWTYSQPAVVFESEEILKNVAATAFSAKVESSLQNQLVKLGFTPGKISITFNKDKTGSLTYNANTNKSIPFTWGVNGHDLSLRLGGQLISQLSKEFILNVKITGNTLQVAADASKLMELVQQIIGNTNSTLSVISSMLKNVNGLYLGLKYTK
ncbi:MAG: DUF4923 family protein [Bacteroidaceae bacterium]|nr:DUF4923 family protein [Bacteroidaceae bacterium]